MLSVLEVTQRVLPTCIIKTDFTYHLHGRGGGGGGWLLQIYVRFLVTTATIVVVVIAVVVIAVIAGVVVVRRGSGGSWPAVVGVFGDFKLQHPHRHPRQFYLLDLKISQIEKNVSLDPTRPCIQTYNQNIKIHVRINSTVKVIRACIFIMLSVLEVT